MIKTLTNLFKQDTLKHLSRLDIEGISLRIIEAYKKLPEISGQKLYRIDPVLLCESLLHLNIDYMHLSLDGSILGMTSFEELGVEIFEDDDADAFYILDGKTVLVESELKKDITMRGRCNFTIAHEASHQIFKMLFPQDYPIDSKDTYFCLHDIISAILYRQISTPLCHLLALEIQKPCLIPRSTLLILIPAHIFLRILQKAPHDHNDNKRDRKRSHNADGLKIAHRAFGEDERDRKKNQQNAPHKLNHPMRLLALSELMIAIAGRRIRDRIKGRGVKRDHGEQHDGKHKRRAGHGADNIGDQAVRVTCLGIGGEKIRRALHLLPKRIVAEDNKAQDR